MAVIRRLTSFGGYDWTAIAEATIQLDDWRGTWRNVVDERPRPGGRPALSGFAVGARRVVVDFVLLKGQDLKTAQDTLLGGLDPSNPAPRLLVGVLADGSETPVQRYARIEEPHVAPLNRAVNGFKVTFVSDDPAWRKVTPPAYVEASLAGNNTTTWESLGTPNNGTAPAYPLVTLQPVGHEAAGGLYRYRRTFTITNNLDETLRNEPIQVALGDTTAWVGAGKAATDGSNVWLFLDGLEQPRDLVGFNRAESWLWLVVDHLAPGETLSYDLVYGGTGTTPLGLRAAGTQPAPDTRGFAGTATAASTTTTITVAGASWVANEWAGGRVDVVAGTAAGAAENILSNTSNTLTLAAAITAPDATSQVVIRASRNDRFVWNVQQVERSNEQRGLAWIDNAEARPETVRFDAPGAWHPYLFLDNADDKTQTDYARIDVGGGDEDSFSILDAHRAAQDQAGYVNNGSADGMAYDSPFPLTAWRFDFQLKNPNGVCTAFFGARAGGARDWTTVDEEATATAVLTNYAAATHALASGTKHLCAVLVPADGEEIGPDWVRETGSATSAASTSLTDGTKAWATDQFAGGVVRIVSGTGAGQDKSIASNTGTTLSFASGWAVTPDATSRYEIVNPPLLANLRTNAVCYVDRDVSGLAISAVSSEANNYPLILTLRLDGGASPTRPYDRLTLGLVDRVLFLAGTERLKVDFAARRAWVVDGAGTWLRDATAYARVEDVETDEDGGTMLAADWWPMSPGAHTCYAQNRSVAQFSLTVEVQEGYYG